MQGVILSWVVLLFFSSVLQVGKDEGLATPPSHELWDALLQKHVNARGLVDYQGFLQDQARLHRYLSALKNQPPDDSWSEAEQMAYWINAYNAFTVQLILDHWPVSSIRDIDEGNPWDTQWIELGGEEYSLNRIEHDILRKTYAEPAIHFALNCAAISCPPLHNRAWTADNLSALLEQKAVQFINNPEYNRISESEMELSRIFDWYGEDFGDVRDYISKRIRQPVAENGDIFFLNYDWGLNAKQ